MNDRKFYMLMHPDHLENWLDFGHCLLIFLILTAFWLIETGQICDFWAFSWEHKRGMVSNLQVDVNWPAWEYIKFWSRFFIYLILVPFWLSETGQIWGFWDFFQNAWEEWPKIWHADLSWLPLELITLGSWSNGFPHFGAILTEWNRSNVQFPGIFVTMYGRNGPKFVMLISILWCPQNWKRQLLAHEKYPVTEQGVSKLRCSQTF